MQIRKPLFFGVLLLGSLAHAKPIVNILGPTTAAVDEDVTLESQVIDPGEGNLSYVWFQASGMAVKFSSQTTRVTHFTVPEGAEGTKIVIELTASDQLESSDAARLTINIAGSSTPNHDPVAAPGAAVTVSPGASVELDGTKSSDPDGDALTYSWVQIAGEKAVITGADRARATLVAPKVKTATSLNIRLTVTDTRGATGSAAMTVTVQPAGCSTTSLSPLVLAALGVLLVRSRSRGPAQASRSRREGRHE